MGSKAIWAGGRRLKAGKRSLGAVKVFRHANVEKESIHLIGGGSDASDLRRQEVSFEREFFRQC